MGCIINNPSRLIPTGIFSCDSRDELNQYKNYTAFKISTGASTFTITYGSFSYTTFSKLRLCRVQGNCKFKLTSPNAEYMKFTPTDTTAVFPASAGFISLAYLGSYDISKMVFTIHSTGFLIGQNGAYLAGNYFGTAETNLMVGGIACL